MLPPKFRPQAAFAAPSAGISGRREFLRFLVSSPLLAPAAAAGFGGALWAQGSSDGSFQTFAPGTTPTTAADVLSIQEFKALTREKLPPAHLGYLLTGVDDDRTLALNQEAFRRYQLRPRRLVDISHIDLRTEVLGESWDTPIFLCPVGGQGAFHPEGEVAVARAARTKKHMQILSTVTSHPLEDVRDALGAPPWFQLYMPDTWDATERLVRRVEDAGCTVMVWTIDLLGGRNTETASRMARADTRDCASCHIEGPTRFSHRPMFRDIQDALINPQQADWSYVERLKNMTSMKVLLKGIDTGWDARLARESGADGIIVSNHGGRATETLRSTIETLPEVIDAVGTEYPVLIDGGFRRGTDIFKALAMGAHAVGVGRPYIYGLSAFGQAGVERVLDILRAELTLIMRQMGTPSIRAISPGAVIERA